MSNRPPFTREQWWLLQTVTAQLDINDADFIENPITSHEEMRDLRALAVEGCLCIESTGRPNVVHMTDTRRGSRWAKQWRAEQAELAAREWESRPVPIRKSA